MKDEFTQKDWSSQPFSLSLCYRTRKNFSNMEQPRRYPIGIQTFSELVNKHYLYIDKTEYVYRMAHGMPISKAVKNSLKVWPWGN